MKCEVYQGASDRLRQDEAASWSSIHRNDHNGLFMRHCEPGVAMLR